MNYHPDRYYHSRPFVKTLLSIYKENAGPGVPTIEALNTIGNSFMQFYNTALVELPFDLRPTSAQVMTQEVSLFMHYARFDRNGRNIFYFQPALTALLRQTDADDIIYDAIRLPYDSLYIAFDKQTDWNLWGQGYLVDGAYVSTASMESTNILQILLTTVRTDLDYARKPNFVLHPDRYYYFPLHFTKKSTNVKTAIEKSIAEHQPFVPREVPDTTGTHVIHGRVVSVVDRGKLTQQEVADDNRESFPIFLGALRLVVNGLCYLSSQHREVDTRFPDDTPRRLLEKLQRASKPAEIDRTTRKLASMGYTKIHFCGDNIQKQFDGLPTGRELTTHWRRGHWRNQAYGARSSEHKLLWIMPTIVRKDKGEPLTGHIYDVGADETRKV